METIERYKIAWREFPTEELDKLHVQALNGQANFPKLQKQALFDVWHERHEGEMKGL